MNRMIWFFYAFICFSIMNPINAAFSERYEQLDPEELPALSFIGPEGFSVNLADYKGRVVVLNFWSITCGPCVAEMPALDQLAGYYPEKDLIVIPINVDPIRKKGVELFYQQNGYRYLGLYQDPARNTQEILKWQALPTTLIINKDGKLIGRLVGAAKWDSPEVLEIFDQLIQGKNPQIESSPMQKLKSLFGL